MDTISKGTSDMEQSVRRKRGRPKGSKNKKTLSRELEKQPDLREPIREVMREDQEFAYQPEDEDDRLKVPKDVIPDGMEYLWVTGSIYGQPQTQRLARFQRQGWVPVPASRHDGMFMPRGHKGYIEVDGLILHERSKKISDMARAHERKKALGQIRAKEAQLMGGDLGGVSLDTQHPTALRTNKISKTYEKVEIPED
jgi:hypothetical protein